VQPAAEQPGGVEEGDPGAALPVVEPTRITVHIPRLPSPRTGITAPDTLLFKFELVGLAARSSHMEPAPRAAVRTRVRIPLTFGDGSCATAEAVTFDGLSDGREHLALILGEPRPGRMPLVRLHSECLTGDVFGSARCDCGPQLREAVQRIAEIGGVLLYLR